MPQRLVFHNGHNHETRERSSPAAAHLGCGSNTRAAVAEAVQQNRKAQHKHEDNTCAVVGEGQQRARAPPRPRREWSRGPLPAGEKRRSATRPAREGRARIPRLAARPHAPKGDVCSGNEERELLVLLLNCWGGV